jgi:hypothetical protein
MTLQGNSQEEIVSTRKRTYKGRIDDGSKDGIKGCKSLIKKVMKIK